MAVGRKGTAGMEWMKEYERWCARATEDEEIRCELEAMRGDPGRIEDAFYRELEFGTGGLRGVLGAGTNRMNVYTVARATQGLTRWIQEKKGSGRVALSYDSRINSERFARTAAEVFAAGGLQVVMYPVLMPTPCLSYAVRELGCDAGVMITASHNPAKYNGYKVYGNDGGQITLKAAQEILSWIGRVDIFEDVRKVPFNEACAAGGIQMIPDSLLERFLQEVRSQSVLFGDEADREAEIVYTPLNGTGREPVTRILRECGYRHVHVVPEQEFPDGRFPTCPSPNPEIREAMELGLELAESRHADLLLATDPDCDRIGIAVRDDQGEMVLLSGNETGMLLLDYICSQRTRHGRMPRRPLAYKTIVTTDMAERIAADYGVEMRNVLTGFKYIGEQIGLLEQRGEADRYIFGFEESYGYLSGTYVRDKDGVNAAFLVCEMFSFYKAMGVSLYGRLMQLAARYGTCLNTQHSYGFEGAAGMRKMKGIVDSFRNGVTQIAGVRVCSLVDYARGVDGLPRSNVLRFTLEGGQTLLLRPSGTEPKLKCYLMVTAGDRNAALELEERLRRDVEARIRRTGADIK